MIGGTSSEMLKEEVFHHHQDQLPLDELLGMLSAQLLECCDSDPVHDTLRSPEGSLEPNCQSSDDPAKFCLPPNGEANDGSTEVVPPAGYDVKAAILTIGDEDDGMTSLSTIFDTRVEDNISASIDFSTSPSVYAAATVTALEFPSNQPERCDFSAVHQPRVTSPKVAISRMAHFQTDPVGSLVDTQLLSIVNICQSSMPSCNFLTPNDLVMSFVHPNINGTNFCADASELVMGGDGAGRRLELGMLGINGEIQTQELDYCRGDGANSRIFYHNSQPPGMLDPGDLQVIGLESQKLLGRHLTSDPPLMTENSNRDDGGTTFKVGKLSPKERKEKIDRYIRKRNERNFSKKIKYVCRKTLADSRTRVRGRFAKNDDQGEALRHGCSNNGSECRHEDDYDDEENNPTSTTTRTTTTEIFGQVSGMSSFNCSFHYPIMDLNSFSDTQLGTF